MKYIVNGDIVLSQPPTEPLAAHIEAFAAWTCEQGYAQCSRYRKVLLASGFSRWLGKQTIRLRGVSSEHTFRYLRSRARRVPRRKGDAAALRQFLEFLRHRQVIPAERPARRRVTAVEQAAQAFEQYLLCDRALARATVINYVPFIRRFLTGRFGGGPVRLSRLRAQDVMRFVQREAPRLHLKRAKLLTTALRSFLRYARYRGAVTLDLAAAVPAVDNWSMASIPRAIPAPAVRQLLASINRRTARGCRDYAILLLLARLGLRGERSGVSRAGRSGLGSRTGHGPRETRGASRTPVTRGCRRGHRHVPPARTPAQPEPPRVLANARSHPRLCWRQCHRLRRATRPRAGGHQRTDQGRASIPARFGDADVAPRGLPD